MIVAKAHEIIKHKYDAVIKALVFIINTGIAKRSTCCLELAAKSNALYLTNPNGI